MKVYLQLLRILAIILMVLSLPFFLVLIGFFVFAPLFWLVAIISRMLDTLKTGQAISKGLFIRYISALVLSGTLGLVAAFELGTIWSDNAERNFLVPVSIVVIPLVVASIYVGARLYKKPNS